VRVDVEGDVEDRVSVSATKWNSVIIFKTRKKYKTHLSIHPGFI
jgi:hypothetical protein